MEADNDSVVPLLPRQSGAGPRRGCLATLLKAGAKLKLEAVALYFAIKNPQCGIAARVMAVIVFCYALNPLDLAAELAPVSAVLMDLIIFPALIWLTLKLIPSEVWKAAHQQALLRPLTLADDWGLAVALYILWLFNVLVGIHITSKHVHNVKQYLWQYLAGGASITTLGFALFAWWRISVESRQQHVPVEQRKHVLAQLAAGSGTDAAAGTANEGSGGMQGDIVQHMAAPPAGSEQV